MTDEQQTPSLYHTAGRTNLALVLGQINCFAQEKMLALRANYLHTLQLPTSFLMMSRDSVRDS
jgi:hypothetical protein